ncbi:MAG: ankyrin repeat domain-containing protein, partial [Planctomycetota bacterium]
MRSKYSRTLPNYYLLCFLVVVLAVDVACGGIGPNKSSEPTGLVKLNKSLCDAIDTGNVERVKLLISKGADVNTKDKDGHTAFSLAEKRGHKAIVELLRKHGANPVNREKLYQLIRECRKEYGASYRLYEKHLSDFERLRSSDECVQRELSELQRAVLLFDVDKLLAIKRHEINATHVYTYHYEGFKAGGGLYVFDVHHPEKEPVELVSTGTGQILDCDLSYDGKVVLFSWRRREDEGYHIWTIR